MNKPVDGNLVKAIDGSQKRLTDYASALSYADLSPDAIHAAKIRIIDTLGVLIGGLSGEPCRILRGVAAQMPSPSGGATLIGTSTRTTPEMAAFVNATTSRYLEYSDLYHGHGSAHGHPSDVVMPVFAAAESVNASGRDLILGVVLAYEVFCRGSDVFAKEPYCNTNLVVLGTSIAAGKLLGLSPEQLSHCMAMAVIPNNILIQVRRGQLTAWKEVAAGHAGRAGVFAAILARAGLEGPDMPFEGHEGWRKNVAGERFVIDGPMGGKSERFRILDTWLRHRPCMGEMIASVIAAEKVAPLRDLEAVKRVLVETNAYAIRRVGSNDLRPVWNPDSRETADHSIPYVVAATLLDGTLTTRSFDEAHLWEPKLRALLSKIEVEENKEFSEIYKRKPRAHRGRVTVFTDKGEQLVGESGGDVDDLAAPRTDAQVEQKFRSLTAEYLGSAQVNSVLELLWHLDEFDDVTRLPPEFAFL